MKVFLHVRTGRPDASEFAERLAAEFAANGVTADNSRDGADLVVAVGGDGTMLSVVAVGHDLHVPVLGFTLGTFGFGAAAEPDEMQNVVSRLISGDYRIAERMTVAATVGDQTVTGVNDVVIEKVDSQRLIELNVDIDGVRFVNYRADGLIVATPTGSTAYSFSAGGPLVSPALDAFVLTPVAAHSLFSRSLVIEPDLEIVVRVSRDRPVKVSIDKTTIGPIGPGDTVIIRKGARPARFVELDPPSFAGQVRHKFRLP
ncbi:MAG: NAD(+)/NADH kinase [Acidimicrobiia bacterium]|nr:NAD(+)/NADH kinase [Acidimicrobiia bacterium]